MNKKTLVKKTSIAGVCLILLYVLLGYFLVPQTLKSTLIEQTKNLTGLHMDFEDLTFNPLSFSVEITNIKVADNSEKTFLTAQSISANYNPIQLVFGQHHFTHLTVIQPEIKATLDTDFNLMTPHIQLKPNQPDTNQEPIDLLIDTIAIEQGAALIQSPAFTQDIDLNQMSFNLKQFNLADIGSNFKINLTTIKNEQLNIEGQYQHNTQRLTTQFKLNNAQSSSISPFIPAELNLSLTQGNIQAKGQINWVLNTLPIINLQFFTWSEFSANWSQNITADGLSIKSQNIKIDLNQKHINVTNIATQTSRARTNSNDTNSNKTKNNGPKSKGIGINWPFNNPIVEDHPAQGSIAQASQDSANDTWQFDIEQLSINNLPFTFNDNALGAELKHTINQASFQNINSHSSTDFSISLTTDSKTDTKNQTTLKGQLQTHDKITIESHISLNNYDLQPFHPWLKELTDYDLIGGTINAQQQFEFNEEHWQSQGELSISKFQIKHQQIDLINLSQLNVKNNLINGTEKTIILDQVTMDLASGIIPTATFSSASDSTMTETVTTENNKDIKTNKEHKDWQIIFGASDIKNQQLQ